jgi:glutaconate CoA-transferase subunit B
VRLPGSGGAAEIAIHAQRTLIVSRLSPRAFPAEVDFVTSPGQRAHGRSRREWGMPGGGPLRVITDRGILAAEPGGELVLAEIFPGEQVDHVRRLVGWELRCAETVASVEPPSERELRLLREVLDPRGLFLKN